MKDKILFLILSVVLVILMISASSSFAQDVDISNMDNTQLMSLLQAIMQKIENDADGGSRNEELDQMKIEKADGTTFRIYENKKLILERIPDYYFIQPQITEEEDDGPSDPDPGKKKDEFNCNDYCHDQCLYAYDDLNCWYECYAVCDAGISG